MRARGWVEQRMYRRKQHPHQRHSDESRASSNDAGDSDDDDGKTDKSVTVEEIILRLCSGYLFIFLHSLILFLLLR